MIVALVLFALAVCLCMTFSWGLPVAIAAAVVWMICAVFGTTQKRPAA